MYIQSRNHMVRSYQRKLELDPEGQAFLTGTECRRKLAGDACSILRCVNIFSVEGRDYFGESVGEAGQAVWREQAENGMLEVWVHGRRRQRLPVVQRIVGRKIVMEVDGGVVHCFLKVCPLRCDGVPRFPCRTIGAIK